VTRQSAEQIVDSILNSFGVAEGVSVHSVVKKPESRKVIIYAPVVKGKKGRHEDVFAALRRNGFARVRVDGEMRLLEEVPELDKKKAHSIDVVIDRLAIPCDRTRLTDSVELALKTGKGVMEVEWLQTPQTPQTPQTSQTSQTSQTPQTPLLKLAIIPLLFECNWDADYDIIICISSPAEEQIRRMVETRGLTREAAEARLSAQLPVSEKAARSHYVVVNDSTVEHLHEEAVRCVEWLRSRQS
jgi:dephospho-CoA kinase